MIALNETLELTSELDQVLKKYIPNLQIKEKSTHINVCFNDDQEKLDHLNGKIRKYGSSNLEFVALSTLMQVDNSCFVRTLQQS